MELSELYKGFQELIGGTDLLRSVKETLFSEQKNDVLSQYVEMVGGDLETDNLQKIFQYYYADRKEKMQDYTPKSIAKLCSVVTENQSGTCYDICAGSGALTIQKWKQFPDMIFVCEELDERVIPLLLFNLSVRNMQGHVICRNVLTLETQAVYRLKKGDRFSEILEAETAPDIEADAIISNPPYNIKWDAPEPLIADERFFGKPIPPSSNANFAFVLTALARMKEDGRCAFVLPNGVLSSDPEKEIRNYLVDSGFIERVVSLPNKMFEATDIGTCVIVFSKGNKTIKFFDCREKAIQEQRAQNGQFGGASHENRTYQKTVNVLSDEIIKTVCGECKKIPGFSQEVAISDIAKNDYNLTPARYIAFEEQQTNHRPYADIIADINRVARERSVIKITCNETLAKELGIYEVAKLENEKSDSALDETFRIVGGKYEGRRYITLSKNKNEIKIENQDKELLSSLVSFFLPMWKQHIFYLNQEENRLLAELRDAMLPDLMSGNLKV